MTCQELVELVTDYLEDKLPPEQRSRFDEHIAGCSGCTAYLAQMRITIELVGELTEETLDLQGKDELLDLFRNWKNGLIS